MSHHYRFKRGDRVHIQWSLYACPEGINGAVFLKIEDYTKEYAAGYQVVLDEERVVTVRWGQLSGVRWFRQSNSCLGSLKAWVLVDMRSASQRSIG